MTKQISKGKCALCNAIFSKTTMTNHLKSCKQRRAASEGSSQKSGSKKIKIFHILVEGRYQPVYWMHLEAPADATLKELDEFFRDIWVECCGHMSAFTILEARYITGAGIDSMWLDMGFTSGGRDMDIALSKVLFLKLKFNYEYDFGTPTELSLKVVAERDSKTGSLPIQILARNEPPQIKCDVCGKTATQVCRRCVMNDNGWFCDKCARKHGCGDDILLPVTNSPRVGICGYAG